MKTEHIVMIVAVAVLSAAALAGVIYGVTTHEEPGFVADMEPTTEPGMTSGRWTAEDPPLWICPRAYAANPLSDADAEAVARNAARVFNDRLGTVLFMVTDLPPDSCDITMTVGVPSEEGWTEPGGTAEFEDASRQCYVLISNVHGEVRHLIATHELGHCLGLVHDTWTGSIMRPVQVETPTGEWPPRITDFDRDLLIERYVR